MNKPIPLKLTVSLKQIQILIALLLMTSVAIFFYSCSNDSLPITPQEQLSFTAQDTADIITLAKTVYLGEIENIVISTARSMSGKTSAIIFRPSNYVEVTFEPEQVTDKLKRYRSIYLSNITWQESKFLISNKSKITRNNWITSSDNLSTFDKTILSLDSCTIEAIVTDADIDTVEHLLNLISASCYSTDSIAAYTGAIDVRDVTMVKWLADFETYNVLIGSRYKHYYILYKDEKVRIVNSSIVMY
ncbi:MAG TPA: hypothetical protein VHP36_00795 [Chitinispirillaceae bacterium]|nr:hypothetical protein [Chitinispirillaceae bacterium]